MVDTYATQLMTIRAWYQEGSKSALRAQVRLTSDPSSGFRSTLAAAQTEFVLEAARAFLEDVRRSSKPDNTAVHTTPVHHGVTVRPTTHRGPSIAAMPTTSSIEPHTKDLLHEDLDEGEDLSRQPVPRGWLPRPTWLCDFQTRHWDGDPRWN